MLIPIEQPFNLTHTLECGQAFRWRREDEWYYGVIYGNILKIRQTLLGVEFNSHPLPEEEIVNRLAYYLRLDDDLPEIYRIIGRDDRMRRAIAQFYAHLYVGLYLEAIGRHDRAREQIAAAAAEQYALGGYMHMVAQVHLDLLRQREP